MTRIKKAAGILPLSEGAGGGLIIIVLFVVSRFAFVLSGGSFLAGPLRFAKQYLDVLLLKNDLLESLFYLHSQPPLFNFFLGTVLKVSPLPDITYELLYKTIGLIMPLLFYAILAELGVKRFFALAATVILMCNPTFILYEHLLYYTYCEAFLVLLAIFFLVHWTTRKGRFTVVLFWATLLCLGLTRSLFHPVFFLATAAILGLGLRRVMHEQRRDIMILADIRHQAHRLAVSAPAGQGRHGKREELAVCGKQHQLVRRLRLQHPAHTVPCFEGELGDIVKVAAQSPDPALVRANHRHRFFLNHRLLDIDIRSGRRIGKLAAPGAKLG